jgi:2-succinyl-5-enolpyruvyl-6-hydroxy-3-cyclohexene-1-carboxylate synthase
LARMLYAQLPASATLVVSSSMPIRDLESFGAPRPDPPRILANRGANGIDGVVSTAIGVALTAPGPTVAYVGDLAMMHDVSALVRGAGPDVACTVVVADNNGGGIFSFLGQAEALETNEFETLFGTPQVPDVADVVAGFGVPVDDIGPGGAGPAFAAALRNRLSTGTLAVIRVRLPGRSENVDIHRHIDRLIVEAVDEQVMGGQHGVGS